MDHDCSRPFLAMRKGRQFSFSAALCSAAPKSLSLGALLRKAVGLGDTARKEGTAAAAGIVNPFHLWYWKISIHIHIHNHNSYFVFRDKDWSLLIAGKSKHTQKITKLNVQKIIINNLLSEFVEQNCRAKLSTTPDSTLAIIPALMGFSNSYVTPCVRKPW